LSASFEATSSMYFNSLTPRAARSASVVLDKAKLWFIFQDGAEQSLFLSGIIYVHAFHSLIQNVLRK
jgi:hypothetical protein